MENMTTDNQESSSSKETAKILDIISKNEAWKLPGILSIIFGILGIFILGLIFAPLALLLATYSLYKKRILLGIVGLILSVIALITSPTFWALLIWASQESNFQKDHEKVQALKQIIEKRKEIALTEQQKHQDALPKFDRIMADWNNDINAFCKDVALYSMSDIDNLSPEQKDFFFNAQEKFPGKIKGYLWEATDDGRKISTDQLKTLLLLIKIGLDTKIKSGVLPEYYYIDVVNAKNLHNIVSGEWGGSKTSTMGQNGNPNPLIIKIKEWLQVIITKKDWDYYVK